jgi:glycosyltransferase involved in cell wall biosynthesis
MRTLALVSTGYARPPDDELRSLEAADLYPRASLFQDRLCADLFDERVLSRVSAPRSLAYRFLPDAAAQVAEAFLVRRRYDAVISWAERLGLPFAALMKATGSSIPHIAIVSWISKPKKAQLLRLVHSHIDRIVTGSSRQRDFAINELQIPSRKVVLLKLFVDQRFFRPMCATPTMICAVGREMRDYATLIEALRPLEHLHCHIAVGGGQPSRSAERDVGNLPAHVTAGRLSYGDLRDLYGRSKFVVVPLLPSRTDNGVTTILEAMAMGKAVISSRTDGQVDIVEEGVTGLLVSPGDPRALRQAIDYLDRNPAIAQKMGAEGRRRVERGHTIDGYMESLKDLVLESLAERRAVVLQA